ncbi:carboxypeptidase-like regulatory domain-containing protein [Winogradskyella sp.]|nr:carboxypeptidase-like regulatory domain-containing protein [Winogradskyella sp.]MDB9782196.1 carboxypeptidase-like regulatory domain-containing protein [Winogradskyella sp.]MDC0006572.1 carboxypeptidase-like regulatory domain-containing protein [Winogradskyella sp.]MDC0009162.1 carboxypeptidase-like regulatory domain-containing protein [Winogradskyella sp.]
MKSNLALNIKSPCTENFNTFSPTKKGGFCGSCKSEVIDFTKMNAEEIGNYFKNNTSKNTCGRFKNTQVQQGKSVRKKRPVFSFISGISLACIAFFSFGSAKAQNAKQNTKTADNDHSKTEDTAYQNTITVKGTILESSLPLPGASIILQGTAVGVQTDFDGKFEFPKKLKKGDILIISYVGMESQKITIIDEKSASNVTLKINMNAHEFILMGKVAVKKVYKSNDQ